MGYTNSKGNPLDRKSSDRKFKQHPDLKVAYHNARKPPAPTAAESMPSVQTEIVLTAVQAKDLQQINDRVGKVTTAKSKKLLDLGLIIQIGSRSNPYQTRRDGFSQASNLKICHPLGTPQS